MRLHSEGDMSGRMRERVAFVAVCLILCGSWAAQVYFGNRGYGLEPSLGSWFTAK